MFDPGLDPGLGENVFSFVGGTTGKIWIII